jgi:hypothetical protein
VNPSRQNDSLGLEIPKITYIKLLGTFFNPNQRLHVEIEEAWRFMILEREKV